MALTPVEIKHIRLGRTLAGGYRRDAVDQLLDDVAASFEDVWRDRADLAEKVEHLEQELVRFKELEALLRTTLVSAERASQELREQARRESELVLAEAHAEGRKITQRAHAERERLALEARRIRAMLHGALDSIDLDDGDRDDGSPADGREEREAA